jgi:hypothetical protein
LFVLLAAALLPTAATNRAMEFITQGVDFVSNLDLNLSGTVARLLLALLFGFPFAIVHRFVLKGEVARHLASIVCGLGLLVWVFGETAIHPLASFTFTYMVVALVCSGIIHKSAVPGHYRVSQLQSNHLANSQSLTEFSRSLTHTHTLSLSVCPSHHMRAVYMIMVSNS